MCFVKLVFKVHTFFPSVQVKG